MRSFGGGVIGRTFFSYSFVDKPFNACLLGAKITFLRYSDGLINRLDVNISEVVRIVYADAWMVEPAVSSRTRGGKCSEAMLGKGTFSKD